MVQRNGTGMFPREVMNRFPLLPLEEEGRLNDMPLRENFIERVFAYYRWTEMLHKEPTPGGLVKFHTAHKLTLVAHSPKHYTEMGRLVADAGKRDGEELTVAICKIPFLIHEALREHMRCRDEILENVLRKVIREELKAFV